MERIIDITQQRYSYSKSRSNSSSIAIEGKERLTAIDEDKILDSYPELVDDKYRGWVIKKLRLLGKREFIKRADRAMKYGTDKQKMFVHLVK